MRMQSRIQLSASVTDVRRSLVDFNRQTRWYVCYRYIIAVALSPAKATRCMARRSQSGDRVTIRSIRGGRREGYS
jgi:hypothetical protein